MNQISSCVLYLRVSTAEQAKRDHVSLEVQEHYCREFAARQNWPVEAVIQDVESGLDSQRPGYLRLLQLPQGTAIVIYRFDRLGRDAAEMMQAVKTLQQRGCSVESATEPTESSFMRGLFFLLAEDGSNRIRARVVPAQRARIEQGKWLGKAPLGYRIVPAPDGRGKTLEPTSAAPAIARLFELYASGSYSLRSLQQECLTLGLGLPPRQQIRSILTHPVYTGNTVRGRHERSTDRKFRDKPKDTWMVRPGLHPAIVSQDTFDQVQSLLARHKSSYARLIDSPHLLTGLIRCARCGSKMSPHPASKSKATPGLIWWQYVCRRRSEYNTCDQPRVSALQAHKWIRSLVRSTFVITTELREMAAEAIRRYRADFYDANIERKAQLERSKAQHTADLRKLALKWVRDELPLDVFRDLERQAEQALASIDIELRKVGDIQPPDLEGALQFVLQMNWDDLDTIGWRDALNILVDHIEVDGREFRVAWRPDVQALTSALSAVDSIIRSDNY